MKKSFPSYTIQQFINQPNKKTEFEITLFDSMDEPDVADIHRHSFYEILWVDKGQSKHKVDYKTYKLNEQSLFFISPGQTHQFEEWQSLQGGTILFTEHFFLLNQQNKDKLFELSFLDNIYSNPNLKLSKTDFQQIRDIIDLLIEERNRNDSNQFILQSLLHILLLQIQRSIDSNVNKIVPKKYIIIYKQFKNLIEENFLNNLTVNEYASSLNITAHHLNRAVKEVTGNTTTDVIRARIILEAKRLLTFSDYSISEIAAQLRLFDSSYFTKLFKKESGLTPSEFKDSMSEKYRRI